MFRIADLFVIRLASADLAGAVDLLQQHHARQVMRQGNASKAEHLVGAGAHVGAQPDGTDAWCVATVGPDVAVPAGATVPAGAMIYDGAEVHA